MTAIVQACSSREDWLAARRSGISGTDVAAIIGISPWSSAMDVYCEKLGLVEPKAETIQMRVGKALEPLLRAEYERETGLLAVPNDALWRHQDAPWAVGTPDALVDGSLGVEFKTASFHAAREWGDQEDAIPDHYLCQVAWYQWITGRPTFHVAVLIGNADFRVYTIRREPGLEALLIEKAREFWERCVLQAKPPSLDGTAATDAYLRSKFPTHKAPLRAATQDEEMLAAQLVEARRNLALAEEREALIAARLKAAIGDSEGLQGDSWRATWKRSKDSTVVDYESVVQHLPQDDRIKGLIAAATKTRPGSRRFLFKEAKEEK